MWTVRQVKGSYKVPFHIMDGDRVVALVQGDQLDPKGASIGQARCDAELIVRAVNTLLVGNDSIATEAKK